ncbi:MAG TPA: hypothetical protein VGD79_11580 [Thermoanaerobaculia bacterium]|jgi:hypothetical protein
MSTRVARTGTVVFLLVFLTACGSSSSKAASSHATPTVSLKQVSAVQDINVSSDSKLPVDYRVTIDNPRDHPVTLTAIEIETVGQSGGYFMSRVRHPFSRTIQAKSSDTIDFRAWVQPLSKDQRGDVTGPVMLRGTARFDSPAGSLRTNFVTRGQ